MKITKETLKQIIKEELEAVQQEGMMDKALDSQFNPLKGMVNQRPAEPMVTGGKLGRFFEDPKAFFESLKDDYPFIEVNDDFAFVPAWAWDIGPGGLEGGEPGDDILRAAEGMAVKELYVDGPEPGYRYYFLHQDGRTKKHAKLKEV